MEAEKADANKCAGFFGALGMCYNQAVKVRYRLGSRNCKQRARASVVRRSLKEAYYGIAEMKTDMERWNEWLRRRIQMYIWKQWKQPRTRVENLKKLGMPDWMAYRNGNTRKGYWAIITISIHPLRGEWDVALLLNLSALLIISIHPLRGEWDYVNVSYAFFVSISIHPLRGEWDLQ